MNMANISTEPAANGKKYPADHLRILMVATLACGLYGAGIGAVVWASWATIKAGHAVQSTPLFPWVVAFGLLVTGMLAIIYGFFFRPREARLSKTQIAIVFWDGNGKMMERSKVESIVVSPSRIVLKGGGKKVVVHKIFSNWAELSAELAAWKQTL